MCGVVRSCAFCFCLSYATPDRIFIALANVFDEMSRDKGIWGFALTEKRFVYKGQRIVGGLLFASVISSTLSLNY